MTVLPAMGNGLNIFTLVFTLQLMGTVTVEAAMPPGPVSLTVSPSPLMGGEPTHLRIDSRRSSRSGREATFDLYVVRIVGFDEAGFLSPTGAWRTDPVPYQRDLAESGFSSILGPGPVAERAGDMQLLVVATRSSGNPRLRRDWLFSPELYQLSVVEKEAPLARDHGRRLLGVATVCTALAWLIVGVVAMWPPTSSRQP